MFSQALDSILMDLVSSDIQQGSLTEITSDVDPLAEVNARILAHRNIQECFSEPITFKGVAKKSMLRSTAMKHVVQPQIKPILQEYGVEKPLDMGHSEASVKNSSRRLKDDKKNEVKLDDGVSFMTADDYLKWRLLPMVAELSKKTPRLSAWSLTFTICVFTLSIGSAALTTFNRSDFMSATLAGAGAVTAWANYQQTDLRLVLTNNSLQELHQVSERFCQLFSACARISNHTCSTDLC
jgi:hypothetical protein